MVDLEGLASFIRIRNLVDEEIARAIGRPAHPGHIAEVVAAAIFDIKLMDSASHKAIDGHFQSGPLEGSSVNIKYKTRKDGLLNLVHSDDVSQHSDIYLVLTGPRVGARSSKGLSAPWVIEQVFVFAAEVLVPQLSEVGSHPGVATSIKTTVWNQAMIYPETTSPLLQISGEQPQQLTLFGPTL